MLLGAADAPMTGYVADVKAARRSVLLRVGEWILGICLVHPLCSRQLRGTRYSALEYRGGAHYRRGALTAFEWVALGQLAPGTSDAIVLAACPGRSRQKSTAAAGEVAGLPTR